LNLQLLLGQAGVPGVEPQLTLEQIVDHDAVAARLAAQVRTGGRARRTDITG
jgi:hypothetical protein